MAFPPSFLDEIRARVALSDVIGRRVRLVRRGNELTGLCPFHNEKTPSFTVSEDKGFYHCFGCGAHGDVIGFLMRDEGLPFPDAVERLAEQAGLEMPRRSPQERAKEQAQVSLYAVMEEAAKWFENQLRAPPGQRAGDYLAGRGLTPEIIKSFRLGFARNDRQGVRRAMLDAGISEAMLITAGLLIRPEGGGEPYDRFRGRVIFPICDRRGRVIAFGGRALDDVQPKYLNSPDTPLFHKGSVLYGLHQARAAARKAGRVITVEGYMDVIALAQAGFVETVAPLGTALTELQLEELWRLVDEPVLCFDGDSAGARAAAKVAERALDRLSAGRSLRFASVPKGADPDSLVRADGPGAFERVLAGAVPLSEQLWRNCSAGEALTEPEARARINKRLSEHIKRIPDSDLRFYYQQHFRVRLSERIRAARWQPQEAGLPRPANDTPPPGANTEIGRSAARERTVLQTILNFPRLIEDFDEEVAALEFSNVRYQALLAALVDAAHAANAQVKSEMCYHMTQRGFEKVVDELVGLDAQYLDWAARDSLADIEDARTQFRHVLDLHHRLGSLERYRQEAEDALAHDPSEENWSRFLGAHKAVGEAPGTEAEMPDQRAGPNRA